MGLLAWFPVLMSVVVAYGATVMGTAFSFQPPLPPPEIREINDKGDNFTHIGLYGPVGLVSRVDECCGGVRGYCHGHGIRFLPPLPPRSKKKMTREITSLTLACMGLLAWFPVLMSVVVAYGATVMGTAFGFW